MYNYIDLKCSIGTPSVNSNYTNMYTQWRVPRKQGMVSNPNPKKWCISTTVC